MIAIGMVKAQMIQCCHAAVLLHALRDSLGLGPDSQVLLINTEGNTDPEYFRRVAWEGVLPVPAEYHWLPTWREAS